MSDETVQTVATEPAPVAQTPVEKKGAVSQSEFSRRIASKQVPHTFGVPTPRDEPAKAETTAPVTEDAKTVPESEVKPTETKEEAEVKAPAETPEATEDEPPEVLSPETHTLDPKLQAILEKRLGKEVAKCEKLKAQVAAAEARATEAEAKLAQHPTEIEKEVAVPMPANVPLPEIVNLDQLNAYKENLATDIIEAEGLLYADFPPEGMQTKWGVVTKPQLIGMVTEAKKIERTQIPAKERFLATKTQSTQTAQEKFPFLKDPTHPGYQMAKQALRDNPVLNAYPNKDYLVGMIVKGQLAMQAEEKLKTELKAPVKPKPKPTSGQSEIASDASIARAPLGAGNVALQAEIARITGGKTGSQDSKTFAAILAAKQRSRNSN